MAQKQQISQQLGQRQQLKLSQQQLLVSTLLEGSLLELEDKVLKEIEANPALEGKVVSSVEEEGEGDDYSEDADSNPNPPIEDGIYVDYDDADSGYGYGTVSSAPEDYNPAYADVQNLTEYLTSQLDSITDDDRSRAIGHYIIGCLDEEGMLPDSPAKITDDLHIYQALDVTPSEVLEMILMVQSLDPAGVCARSVAESLRLQTERKMSGNFKEDFTARCAVALLDEFFDEFIGKKYSYILKNIEVERDVEGEFVHITSEELDAAIDFIRSLNPHPCQLFSSSKLQKASEVIIPDFYYDSEQGKLTINCGHLPKLSVSEEFTSMLKRVEDMKSKGVAVRDGSETFLRDRVDAANNFIEAVNQRMTLLEGVMTQIIKVQKDFFDQGCDDSQLKPLTMKQVAEAVGCDISTVSRVANSKYINVNGQDTFKIKHFFSEGISTESGDSVSNKSIMETIKKMISEEDTSDPLTDDAIAAALQSQGYNVARRTVAKYRGALNIPSTRERRK